MPNPTLRHQQSSRFSDFFQRKRHSLRQHQQRRIFSAGTLPVGLEEAESESLFPLFSRGDVEERFPSAVFLGRRHLEWEEERRRSSEVDWNVGRDDDEGGRLVARGAGKAMLGRGKERRFGRADLELEGLDLDSDVEREEWEEEVRQLGGHEIQWQGEGENGDQEGGCGLSPSTQRMLLNFWALHDSITPEEAPQQSSAAHDEPTDDQQEKTAVETEFYDVEVKVQAPTPTEEHRDPSDRLKAWIAQVSAETPHDISADTVSTLEYPIAIAQNPPPSDQEEPKTSEAVQSATSVATAEDVDERGFQVSGEYFEGDRASVVSVISSDSAEAVELSMVV